MSIAEDFQKLQEQVSAELTVGLSRLAQIDEQIKELRAQRRLLQSQVATARGALKFAELAKPKPEPTPSPALERAKAALEATETVAPSSGPTPLPDQSAPAAP